MLINIYKNNNEKVDYFLMHDFFQIVLEYYEDDWHNVVPVSNSAPHILLLRLFDKYDEKMLEYIKNQIPFQKLSYKFIDKQKSLEGTFYKWLVD